MREFIYAYANFFEANWILLTILWVLLIILARTKMEMKWLDIYLPAFFFLLWGISESLIHFVF